MNDRQFENLCRKTPTGTPLSFGTGEVEIRGKFVGCTNDGVIIEANGRHFIWPRDLIDVGRTDYPIPSYS